MFLFDAHLDLSMNALEWNRDLRLNINELRERERGLTDKKDRGNATVCFPEMRRGEIGLCVATQIARYVEPNSDRPGWNSPEQAWAQTQGQLAWYRAMEEAGDLVQVKDLPGLEKQLELWQNADSSEAAQPLPIGYILTLEGADSILSMPHLEHSYEQGLRALGPAHYGPGLYSPGTESGGAGLTAKGRELLKEMDRLGIILDVTHLTDKAFWEALEIFSGPVWASHCNCRTFVSNQRQLNDEQLKALIQRGAIIGMVFDAWMMHEGWVRQETTPQSANLKLDRILQHIDHICQLAGNANHVGIGSDLDGGYGREQCPMDLETIADLQQVITMLGQRGFSEEDLSNVAHLNFIRFLRAAWK